MPRETRRGTARRARARTTRRPPPLAPDELGAHASGTGALGDVGRADEALRDEALDTGAPSTGSGERHRSRDDEPLDVRPDATRALDAVDDEGAIASPPIDDALAALDRARGGLEGLRTDDRRRLPGEHAAHSPLSGEPRAIEGSRGAALRDGCELVNEDEDPPAAAPGRLRH